MFNLGMNKSNLEVSELNLTDKSNLVVDKLNLVLLAWQCKCKKNKNKQRKEIKPVDKKRQKVELEKSFESIRRFNQINEEIKESHDKQVTKLKQRQENHSNLRDSHLVIEFVILDDASGVFANNANIRLVKYGMMALFSSVKLETSGARTIEYIDHCNPNLLMHKLLTSTVDKYESSFVRNQGNRDSQLKGDHIAAERGPM